VRAAEARAAALSGIKAMPEKPLVLLYQLVELMKIQVDQLREKCLEERVDPVNLHHASHSSQQEKQGEAAAGGDKAAGEKGAGGEKPQTLMPSNSTRGISSSRYSSLASSPDDWRLDDSKPCSGERLLLMFDRCGSGCLF
jgi:inositol hexakisphosphate/diphosphoinositol-pentakisphosphate kinase